MPSAAGSATSPGALEAGARGMRLAADATVVRIAVAPGGTPPDHRPLRTIVMSLGLGLAFPALSSTALIKLRERDSGVASTMVNTTQQVRASLGAALLNTIAATATAGYIASAFGSSSGAMRVVHGFTVAFAV